MVLGSLLARLLKIDWKKNLTMSCSSLSSLLGVKTLTTYLEASKVVEALIRDIGIIKTIQRLNLTWVVMVVQWLPRTLQLIRSQF